jgi:hypothetical protein
VKLPAPHRPTPDGSSSKPPLEQVDAAKARRSLRNGFTTLILGGALIVGLLLAVPGLKGVATTLSHMKTQWVLVAILLEVLSCASYVVVFLQVFERAPLRLGARVALSEEAFGAAVSLGGVGSIAVGGWLMVERGAPPRRIAERYRCGDTSANRCRRRAAVKADRVEAMVLDAVRAYSATSEAHGRAPRGQRIREADEAIKRANAELDDTILQLGELGLLGRPASRETLEKLANTLDDAHTVRARLGKGGESNVIGPDEIDELCEPGKRLAAWRQLISDTVESVTVAPAMTADGRPSRLWDPRRIDIRFLGQQLACDPVERVLDLRADAPRYRQHR